MRIDRFEEIKGWNEVYAKAEEVAKILSGFITYLLKQLNRTQATQ